MRHNRRFLVGGALLLLTGCAAPGGGSNEPPRVVVEGDQFSTAITISGVQILDNPLLGDDTEHWYLRSFVDPGKRTVAHRLYAELTYPGLLNRGYTAADNHAQAYPVDTIARGRCSVVVNCGREDTVGIAIEEATLRANAATGMQFKITARSGYSVILAVTPLMINAQLYAAQEILSGAVVVGKTVKSGDTIPAGP